MAHALHAALVESHACGGKGEGRRVREGGGRAEAAEGGGSGEWGRGGRGSASSPVSRQCSSSLRFSLGLSTLPKGLFRNLRQKREDVRGRGASSSGRTGDGGFAWACRSPLLKGKARHPVEHAPPSHAVHVRVHGAPTHFSPRLALSSQTLALGQMTCRQSCRPMASNSSTQTP